jgi:hypothetical protein
MDEAEWLACDEPRELLAALRGKASDRKLRLFACACCRRVWHLMQGPSRHKVAAAERQADGLPAPEESDPVGDTAGPAEAAQTNEAADSIASDVSTWAGRRLLAFVRTEEDAVEVADRVADGARAAVWNAIDPDADPDRKEREAADIAECRWQAHLLRDLLGNPFRPTVLEPSWLTPIVAALARAAYDERSTAGTLDPSHLAVLADALEDTGCTDAELLGHLRGPGPHVLGCWTLDLLLAKR